MLAKEFVESMRVCSTGPKLARWRKALENLAVDPIFKEADVAELAEASAGEEFEKRVSALFNKLSSGHKIVLLTTTKLVETVEERSLVLLDEPESHLHRLIQEAVDSSIDFEDALERFSGHCGGGFDA